MLHLLGVHARAALDKKRGLRKVERRAAVKGEAGAVEVVQVLVKPEGQEGGEGVMVQVYTSSLEERWRGGGMEVHGRTVVCMGQKGKGMRTHGRGGA